MVKGSKLGFFKQKTAYEMRISDWSADVCSADLVSYAETASWSRRLADGLAALGVRRGDRVGLLMANYLEFTPLKFAIARAGAVAVPFNYLYRTEELAYVLRQSRRSEEHTSELQSLMRISYAVFCLKKKLKNTINNT